MYEGEQMSIEAKKFSEEYSHNQGIRTHNEIPQFLRKIDNEKKSFFAKYDLVGAPYSVKISRDPVSQLISVEILSISSDNTSESLGIWQISAYQTTAKVFTMGSHTAKLFCSPFYLDIRFFQKSIGINSEIAAVTIRPKVLKPGDIPVVLSGAWVTMGAQNYDGLVETMIGNISLSKYLLNGTNLEVAIGKNRSTGLLVAQFSLRDERGAKHNLATWQFDGSDISKNEIKLGQYTVKVVYEEDSFALKFMDKTLGIFPTEIGYIEIDLNSSRKAVDQTIPVYLSGSWKEVGVNFDKQFFS